jgi:hypothetical protein
MVGGSWHAANSMMAVRSPAAQRCRSRLFRLPPDFLPAMLDDDDLPLFAPSARWTMRKR